MKMPIAHKKNEYNDVEFLNCIICNYIKFVFIITSFLKIK